VPTRLPNGVAKKCLVADGELSRGHTRRRARVATRMCIGAEPALRALREACSELRDSSLLSREVLSDAPDAREVSGKTLARTPKDASTTARAAASLATLPPAPARRPRPRAAAPAALAEPRADGTLAWCSPGDAPVAASWLFATPENAPAPTAASPACSSTTAAALPPPDVAAVAAEASADRLERAAAAVEPSASRLLRVDDVPAALAGRELAAFFATFGELDACWLRRPKNNDARATARPRALVRFDAESTDVENASAPKRLGVFFARFRRAADAAAAARGASGIALGHGRAPLRVTRVDDLPPPGGGGGGFVSPSDGHSSPRSKGAAKRAADAATEARRGAVLPPTAARDVVAGKKSALAALGEMLARKEGARVSG